MRAMLRNIHSDLERKLRAGRWKDEARENRGEEGWEIVSAVPSPGDALIIFLKRPIEGQ
jgi:hypothetical protein